MPLTSLVNITIPSAIKVQVAQVATNIRAAAVETRDAPRTIVNRGLAGIPDEIIFELPKIKSMENAVSRRRKRQGLRLDIPHSLAEVYFPDELRFTKTAAHEDYILEDTGSEDAARIILLASKTDLKRLTQCETWLADGTFHAAPEIIFQIYSIHGLYAGRVVPFVIALLPNKTRQTYERILQLLRDKIDGNEDPQIAGRRPTNFNIDFEKAAEMAIRRKLPATQIHGCWFHFTQAHWRKIQDLGLAVPYGQESAYEYALKKFSALAFCNIADVGPRFNHHANFIAEFGNTERQCGMCEAGWW